MTWSSSSQVVEDILDPDNTASDVWADSAYRSAEIEAKLEDKGLKSRIHRKGHRDIVGLFTNVRGQFMIGGSLVMIGMGALVMRQMINFDI